MNINAFIGDDELFVMNPALFLNLVEPNRDAIEHMNIEEEHVPLLRNERYYEETVPHYNMDDFHGHFRMSRQTMEIVCQDIANRLPIGQKDLDKQVSFSIWMLAKPESFRACCDRFNYPRSTGHNIYTKIISVLSQMLPEHIKWPNEEETNYTATKFAELTRFPRVIGAIDGCQIPIKAPAHNPIDYYNRKSFHSIILQGVCNDRMIFSDVFIGMPGRCHDARVFRNSPLYNKINNGNLINPQQHLLGDNTYPLIVNLMTPFKDNGHLSPIQNNYNMKLSSARSKIEQAFGRLKGKWRRLKYLDMSIENVPDVIAAACVLHNYTLRKDIDLQAYNYEPEENMFHERDDIDGFRNVAQEKRNIIMQEIF